MIPKTYSAPFVEKPISLTGRGDEPLWARAPWTDAFVDILGPSAPTPRFETRVKMAWSEDSLYILAKMKEPHVWGTLTEHDSVIFHDNDFEVFLDPDGDRHQYMELEVNALNTTWDLLLVRPYRDGGPALDGWEIRGLETRVAVDGSLNNPVDQDNGWSLEIRIPFRGLREISTCPVPPRPGDVWRINFSRVEWHHELIDGKYRKVPNTPEDNWVWTPQGVVDMHRPERWGFLRFDREVDPTPVSPSPEEELLLDVYYRQRERRERTGQYARNGAELGIADLDLDGSAHAYRAERNGWSIDHEGRLRRP